MVKASMLPRAVTRAINAQTLTKPWSSINPISRATTEAASVPTRSRVRRDHRSAMAPDNMPSTKKGSILAAAATPTMNSEPVSSYTSQPTETCSIPVASE